MNNPNDEKDSSPLRMGGALDALLMTEEDYSQVYTYFKGKRPTPSMQKFVDNLPPHLTTNSDQSEYQDAYEMSGYKSSRSAVITRF